jgi:pimeloyl-ACP methyl ester carboxylesterase
LPPPPAGSAATDPTLDHLREQFAAGHVEEARAAVLQLSPQGRSEIEARLGAATVARMVRAARTVRTAVLGRVVVVHGIMGGKLATVDPSGDEDLVWMHYLRLVAGRIEDLTLDSNAEPLDPRLRVVTQGLLDEYMPLVFELSQRWRVLPFAFDWRLNIDRSAAQLDREIRRWSGGEPTHVVAHSMGGLVARRFMQMFPTTWEAMTDPVGLRRGGRLVMLGTPNRGSFAIPLVLTGQERTLKLLAAFDLKHDMKEILNVVNTFPGSYQMLPSPASHAGDDRLRLYDAAEWAGFPCRRSISTWVVASRKRWRPCRTRNGWSTSRAATSRPRTASVSTARVGSATGKRLTATAVYRMSWAYCLGCRPFMWKKCTAIFPPINGCSQASMSCS